MYKSTFYCGLLLLFLGISLSCTRRATLPQGEGLEPAIKTLLGAMSGQFSSAEQAARDTLFYDISLAMVPIWEDDTRYGWLYVEQAVTAYKDQPYRQRVYRLSQAEDGTFESRVYELQEPERFIHAWEQSDAFATLTPDSLSVREGCSVFLKKDGNCYVGATKEDSCRSTLRGATYATSKVEICADAIVSWDQGWDEAGEQVWGAETEGYVFDRVE